MFARWTLALCLLTAGQALAAPGLEPGATVAFLGIHLADKSVDMAHAGGTEADLARVALLEQTVRDRLVAEGMASVDLAPVAGTLARTSNPARCNGCDIRMGQSLGARYVMEGEMQKITDRMLLLNVLIRDTTDGTMVRGRSVNIRENTDDGWLRGLRYVLDNGIFKD